MATKAASRLNPDLVQKDMPLKPLSVPSSIQYDPSLSVTPHRPSGNVQVQLIYVGRGKPIPADDPELSDEDAA